MNNLKILVIDDSSVALKITVQLLQDAGHEAEGLNRPEEALDRIRQLQPDIVVCDIMMPGVNGLEVLLIGPGAMNDPHFSFFALLRSAS